MQTEIACGFAYGSQAMSQVTELSLLAGGLELSLVSYMRYVIVQVDVTEVFRQIPRQKVIRIVKLVLYLIAFVYFIFR